LNHSRWNLLPPMPEKHLANVSVFSPLIAQLLYNRGLSEPSQIESFISSDKRLSGDPFLLPDMQQAVNRIYRALLSGENIAIYGDFDVDGITATALLVEGLSILGSEATVHIPHRLTEGHGLRTAALENLHQQGINLVITVDCGITGFTPVKKANKMGMDVIITDHHTPPPAIPPATAVVDPKLSHSNYPFTELAGVGVSFKLVQALLKGMGKEKYLDGLLDLAALGTISDMMPLLGENRYLVKSGLEQINAHPRLGIKEMITQAGLDTGNLDPETISWVISPRLNAAGRVAHAISSYNLLTTTSPQEAQELSVWLEQKNTERQKLTTTALAEAREQVLAQGIPPLMIAGSRDFPAGIAGLVAGRLSEEFYRPAIVVKVGEKISGGSCRSIPEFNIIQALEQCRGLLLQFGGHPKAAGFSLLTHNLPRLQYRLSQLAATRLDGVDLRPCLDIDAEITLPELSGDTYQSMQQLAPFGYENPLPTFLSRRVEVVDCRTMGNSEEHLRMKVKQGGTVWNAVAFRLGNFLAETYALIDIVYNLEIDRWGGEEKLRLNILDFAPADSNISVS